VVRVKTLIWAGICAAVVAVGASAPADAAQKRVLLVTEARGFVHDSIPDATAFFKSLGARSRRYDVVQLEGATQLTRRRLARANAVVFANTSGELAVPSRRALLRFVRRGGGFIGTHSATDTLHSWPGYARLVGGEFGRHGAVESGRVNVSARPHVTTRGLPRSFQITDEFYEFTAPVPAHARVLARLDPESVPDELGSTLPLAWARRYGDGRVFYNALGHRKETWRDPNFRRLTSRGLAWALGS
jgi:type 1 glutamine amidotransferase